MAQISPDQPGANDPGRGRRLGLDVGTVRIGVALSGSDATLAMPLETIPRKTGFRDHDKADIDRIIELIDEYSVVEVVIGLPRNLDGSGSKSVQHAKEIGSRIDRRLKDSSKTVPVRFADERLSTIVATTALQASGVKAKAGRKIIDQAAAVEILQSWLDGRQTYLS